MTEEKAIGYRRHFATLRIFGTIPEIDAITQRLGVKPDHVHRKGQQIVHHIGKRIIRSNTLYSRDSWQLKAQVPRNRALTHHVQWLHRHLVKKTSYLKQLVRKYDVDLYCSYHSDYDQGRLEFPPEVLKWCGELGIPIHVSILVQE